MRKGLPNHLRIGVKYFAMIAVMGSKKGVCVMRTVQYIILGVVCVAGAGCVNEPFTSRLTPEPNTCQVIYSRGGTPMQTV